MHPKQTMCEEKSGLRCDYVPGCWYKIWQDAREFCFTTDAVFLGNFNKNIAAEKAESRFVEIYSSLAYNTSETGFKIYYDKGDDYIERTN